jgi:hypothetical protein
MSRGFTGITWVLDAFLTDVESAAPLTTVDRQSTVDADAACGLVPELQGNSMPVCGAPVLVERLPTSGIGARENDLGSNHGDESCRFTKNLDLATRSTGRYWFNVPNQAR